MSKKSFYGSKISDNIISTPEKYLICLGVPLARTGDQEYLVEEIFTPEDAERYGLAYGEKVTLHRRAEDLFTEDSLKSYEGKSFTFHHPPDMVDIDNVYEYEMGHVQNIRQDGEYIIGDIIVKDASTIEAIKNGTREISCGYGFDIAKDADGNLYQTNFIGNHVALVEHGRAGSKVRIYDHAIKEKTMTEKKGSIFARMFKAFAKDADGEAIDEALEAIAKDDDASKKDDEFMKKEKKNQASDSPFEQRFAELEAKMDKVLEVFAKAAEEKAKCAAESATEAKDSAGEEKAKEEAKDSKSDGEAKDSKPDEEAKDSKPDEEAKDSKPNEEAKDGCSEGSKEEAKDGCHGEAKDARPSNKGDMVYALIANRQKPKEVSVADLGDKIARMYNPHYKEKK